MQWSGAVALQAEACAKDLGWECEGSVKGSARKLSVSCKGGTNDREVRDQVREVTEAADGEPWRPKGATEDFGAQE